MRGRAQAIRQIVAAAAVLGASGLAWGQCTKDTDCKGDRVCDAGKCTSPLPPAPPPPPGGVAPTPSSTTPAAPVAPAPATESTPPADAAAPPPAAPGPTVGAPAAPPFAVAPAATQPLPPADEPPKPRRSKPAMVAGIIMVSVTPLALLGALAAKNAQDKCDSDLARDYPMHVLPTSERYRVDDCNAYSAPFYALAIGGGVLGVGGLALIIYGAPKRPATPRAASVQLSPWANPTSGGLRLRVDL